MFATRPIYNDFASHLFLHCRRKNLINLSKNGFLLRSWFVSSNLAWLGRIREVTPMQWQDITSLLGLYYDNIASVEKFPRQGYKIRWILVNKSVSKLKLSQKNGNNILFFSKCVFSNKNYFQKVSWHSKLTLKVRFWHFLTARLFTKLLCQKIYLNFVSLPRKPDNWYCHSLYTRLKLLIVEETNKSLKKDLSAF